VDLLALKSHDFNLLNRAAQESVAELQAQAQGCHNVYLDRTATPGTAANCCFTGGQAVAIKPPAGDSVETVLKHMDRVDRVEGGYPHLIAERQVFFGYLF